MNISFKTLLIGIFLILVENLCAQQDTLKYWIQFTDKNNSPFSINSPEQFLSSKAIARRTKSQISISGNLIASGECKTNQKIEHQLHSGIYLVKIKKENLCYTKRLIVE
jgi:hypothetical protein